MPIRNFPFRSILPGEPLKPYLPIRIVNPKSGESMIWWGLVDTGADSCAIPADMAGDLSHILKKGKPVSGYSASGESDGYIHTTNIEILDYDGNVVYEEHTAEVEYTVGLPTVLLGVKGFLDSFVLTVDYKNQCFSITYHKSSKRYKKRKGNIVQRGRSSTP